MIEEGSRLIFIAVVGRRDECGGGSGIEKKTNMKSVAFFAQ